MGFQPRETLSTDPAPGRDCLPSRASTNQHRLGFKSETGAGESGFLAPFQGQALQAAENHADTSKRRPFSLRQIGLFQFNSESYVERGNRD
jgi:hypothetical protein